MSGKCGWEARLVAADDQSAAIRSERTHSIKVSCTRKLLWLESRRGVRASCSSLEAALGLSSLFPSNHVVKVHPQNICKWLFFSHIRGVHLMFRRSYICKYLVFSQITAKACYSFMKRPLEVRARSWYPWGDAPGQPQLSQYLFVNVQIVRHNRRRTGGFGAL